MKSNISIMIRAGSLILGKNNVIERFSYTYVCMKKLPLSTTTYYMYICVRLLTYYTTYKYCHIKSQIIIYFW